MEIFDSIKVGRDGAEIKGIVHGTIAGFNPGTITANTTQSASAAAGGLRSGMKVFVATKVQQTGIPCVGGECTADDVITLWFANSFSADRDPGSALTIDYLAIK